MSLRIKLVLLIASLYYLIKKNAGTQFGGAYLRFNTITSNSGPWKDRRWVSFNHSLSLLLLYYYLLLLLLRYYYIVLKIH